MTRSHSQKWFFMPIKKVLTQGKKRQGLALLQGNRLYEAKALFEQICAAHKNDIESWIFLVQINAQLGQPGEVERCCRAIIAVMPNSLDAHYHLGCALMLQGKLDEAAATFQEVLRLNPNHALTHLHLGKTYHLAIKFDEALKHYRRTIELEPRLTDTYGLIGGILQNRGLTEEAIAYYRQGLAIAPGLHKLHSELLLSLNCVTTDDDTADLSAEHARWGKLYAPPSSPAKHANAPDPERRLRVGYVSPDLREHSVAYFFEPLLASHNPENVETYCYAEVASPDSATKRLQSLSTHWLNTCGMNDRQLADRIRADGIDILVDLAGHTANNRLLVFALKPAPLQVSYLGYPNTTGLAAMDYRFTDEHADPPGATDSFHTEKLIRLPHGFLCYRAPTDSPPARIPPAVERGYVTFGSFNHLPKVTPEAVALWAAVLLAVPNSRMVMKNTGFSVPAARDRYASLFAGHGIDPNRLDLLGPTHSAIEHLATYRQVDIALDSFPYNGTTTTCEALWMGVPVVAIAGRMHAGRVGVSLLSQVGLDTLIADTPDEYTRIASSLTRNISELATLCASLRPRMESSPLCNEKCFAADVEAAYRSIWRQWCAGRGA